MATHIQYGKECEQLASEFLVKNGYKIIFNNWRFGRYEIDIVATKNEVVHFVEVKARRSVAFGHPEKAVTQKKFECLKKGATAFQNRYPFVKKIQFDVISVTHLQGKNEEIFFIEDVFL